MIAYGATLDVPRELVRFVAKLLLAEHRRRGTPRGSRALTCFWQAVLGVRWFRDRTTADRWPGTTASPGPPPTATSMRSSSCWRRRPPTCVRRWSGPGTRESRM